MAILHRIVRYMDTPGDNPSGFHDRVLGLLGDILPHQYPAVEVPTVNAMQALIPTWDDPSVPLGPYNEADPETEVARPRNTQLIPGKYAALIIHRRRVKPKQAYQEIVGAIRADDALDSCGDVVSWLCAACTARGGGGGAQNAMPSVLHALVPVHLPPEVYQYLTQTVQGGLPGLAAPGVVGPESAATLVGALRALTRRESGDDGGRTTREPKSVADAYKETHPVLLRFCQVSSVDDVSLLCGNGWQQTVIRASSIRCLRRSCSGCVGSAACRRSSTSPLSRPPSSK